MSISANLKSNLVAIILTGGFTAAGQALVLQVHIDYIKDALVKNETINLRQDTLLRKLELQTAILSDAADTRRSDLLAGERSARH